MYHCGVKAAKDTKQHHNILTEYNWLCCNFEIVVCKSSVSRGNSLATRLSVKDHVVDGQSHNVPLCLHKWGGVFLQNTASQKVCF